MKKIILFLLGLPAIAAIAQDTPPPLPINPPNNNQVSTQSTGRSDRISFIVGPGASFITRKIYDNPAVNQTNNIVMINRATNIKTNLAVGIIYTPYIWDITRRIKYIDVNGQIQTRQEIESVPKGRTIAAFINPVAFTKVTETQPFFNMLDFGVGYGHRFAGGLLLMATAEFFSVRQPRKWFIDEFKGKNKAYEIEGAAQKTIDVNDNSIFTYKPVITFGFKLCYSFDIIKNYVTGAQSFSPGNPPAINDGSGNPANNNVQPPQ